MATYSFASSGDYLVITINGTITFSYKKKYIEVPVPVEPYVEIKCHNKENNESRFRKKIDFNDVTSPAEASAADLKMALDAMLAPAAGYSDEQAQDSVGNSVDTDYLAYDDPAPEFTFADRAKASIEHFMHLNKI